MIIRFCRALGYRTTVIAALTALAGPGYGMQRISAGPSLVRALDCQLFTDHIRKLSSAESPIHGTRHHASPGNVASRDYLVAQLESYGYSVDRHIFAGPNGLTEQVYVTKIGKDPRRMYIVGAHMDSANVDRLDPNRHSPGADDNASGTSLVLEVARVFAPAAIETDVSIRFIFWNVGELLNLGSESYIADRNALQGIEDPPGSGLYPEPIWLGMIQHDMLLWDHGNLKSCDGPPWPPQSTDADIDIEYAAGSEHSHASLALAVRFRSANATYATDYPAEIGINMCCTDSTAFMNLVPAISIGENRRASEIGAGSNPHWHKPTDAFESYGTEDFLLGFNSVQTTAGALSNLVNATTPLAGGPTPASWGGVPLCMILIAGGAMLLGVIDTRGRSPEGASRVFRFTRRRTKSGSSSR